MSAFPPTFFPYSIDVMYSIVYSPKSFTPYPAAPQIYCPVSQQSSLLYRGESGEEGEQQPPREGREQLTPVLHPRT